MEVRLLRTVCLCRFNVGKVYFPHDLFLVGRFIGRMPATDMERSGMEVRPLRAVRPPLRILYGGQVAFHQNIRLYLDHIL